MNFKIGLDGKLKINSGNSSQAINLYYDIKSSIESAIKIFNKLIKSAGANNFSDYSTVRFDECSTSDIVESIVSIGYHDNGKNPKSWNITVKRGMMGGDPRSPAVFKTVIEVSEIKTNWDSVEIAISKENANAILNHLYELAENGCVSSVNANELIN